MDRERNKKINPQEEEIVKRSLCYEDLVWGMRETFNQVSFCVLCVI